MVLRAMLYKCNAMKRLSPVLRINLWRKQGFLLSLWGLRVVPWIWISWIPVIDAMEETVSVECSTYHWVMVMPGLICRKSVSHVYEWCGECWLCFCGQNEGCEGLTSKWLIPGLVQTKALRNRPFRGPFEGLYRIGNWLFWYQKSVLFVGEKLKLN